MASDKHGWKQTDKSRKIDDAGGASDLEREVRLRCFWAAWIATCLNSENYVVGASADSLVINMPLPMSEGAFEQSLDEPTVVFSDLIEPRSQSIAENNLSAYLMKAMLGW